MYKDNNTNNISSIPNNALNATEGKIIPVSSKTL